MREAPDMREGEGREGLVAYKRVESMPPFIDRLLRMARRVLVFLTLFFFFFSSFRFDRSFHLLSLFLPFSSVCLIKLAV